MSIQAAQFAATFDRLGRRMLAQLESFPEELWDRAPLIPLIEEEEIVRQISGTELPVIETSNSTRL